MARTLFAAAPARLHRFEPFFSARTRARGVEYAAAGRVEVVDANHAWLSALVQGTEEYDVELELRRGKLFASCTCPYFADNADPCKHVWATLVVGEADGALPWLSDAQGLALDPLAGAYAETAIDDPFDDAPRVGPSSPPTVRAAPHAVPTRTPPRAASIGWRDVVSLTSPAPPAPEYGRADLRYVIDTSQTRLRGRLRVRLFKRVGKAAAPQWRETSPSHPLAAFAPASDALLVALLEACDPAPPYAYRARTAFDVPADAARELVERMGGSGRLRLDAADGPAMIWDPSAYTVALDVAPRENGKGYEVHASLERSDEKLAASEPALVMVAGLAFWRDRAARVDGSAVPWLIQHRLEGPVPVPANEIDDARRDDPSAKLEILLDRLQAIREQGQKGLVFSQFTSLLSIVRERLDARGIAYAYLDGQTRDRAAPVTRFQSDCECGVFLISLKAGGLGLNLTAAEYVFLLDPWWNPAVEAQAIDRAHRIGQRRKVIAYRLLARGTVEDKVAELQTRKRELADALLGGSGASLGGLTREDLAQLLS